ncbi:MBL fold metallo-hydrolase [Planctomicrobium sp. SH527]|uniref:MBL fold metallo-hydrolase n=1 Tax=Planctomicrobium sp. SH527 TaxID=3448123 RepID=UPI003F5C3FB1
MKITFLGAAGEVTGSQHLIETSRRRLLLDCGFFQGPRAESRRKNEHFYCNPPALDAVILSHAHIDHCGNLPRLYRSGFRGPIFCTDATADIAELMLLDSAKIQEEDAIYLSRKLNGSHPPIDPLYTTEDVREVMKLFEPISFNEWTRLDKNDEVRIRFLPAGHILGSAITELVLKDEGETKRVVFTGDMGRRDTPLLNDPAIITDGADAVICEATYGNRMHPSQEDLKQILLDVFEDAMRQGGRVIIPAFALGRTQQVTHFLNELHNAGKLPSIPIYVDSPLAMKVTHLFLRHKRDLDADVQRSLTTDEDPFHFPGLTYIENQKQSIDLNRVTTPLAIIAASGMCENGRVVHHLKHAIGNPRNTVLLMGYQAPNTLGRRLAEGHPIVRIFGQEFHLKAKVEQVHGLSAHGDAGDLSWWFKESSRHANIGKAFLVHAEPDAAESLSDLIRNYVDEAPIVPRYRETFEV